MNTSAAVSGSLQRQCAGRLRACACSSNIECAAEWDIARGSADKHLITSARLAPTARLGVESRCRKWFKLHCHRPAFARCKRYLRPTGELAWRTAHIGRKRNVDLPSLDTRTFAAVGDHEARLVWPGGQVRPRFAGLVAGRVAVSAASGGMCGAACATQHRVRALQCDAGAVASAAARTGCIKRANSAIAMPSTTKAATPSAG